ncbi:MAG: COX15/CtaA family protein [Proteobacteria bacterium]|nr:COX15/CtaA family protein [Pseudomonadota bacterium]
MQLKSIKIAAGAALILAFIVVILGAYTRLTDAGLGCPDWPGCYGHMVLPQSQQGLSQAQTEFPAIPIESGKAWTEMIHRYLAGTLGLFIFFIALSVIVKKIKKQNLPWKLPLALVFLVIFQAALGMWTVTLKLLPVVVMSHLLGGILIFSLLATYNLQLRSLQKTNRFFIPCLLGCIILFIQIALGGWVSSNYAGIACVGFPQCNGQWLPSLHFSEGFNLFAPVGENYQGGLLENDIRVTIQLMHRLGAIITALYLLILSSFVILKAPKTLMATFAKLALILVLVQFVLGIMNVVYLLPLSIAVLHNAVAALLMATLASMLYLSLRNNHAS